MNHWLSWLARLGSRMTQESFTGAVAVSSSQVMLAYCPAPHMRRSVDNLRIAVSFIRVLAGFLPL